MLCKINMALFVHWKSRNFEDCVNAFRMNVDYRFQVSKSLCKHQSIKR